MTYLGARSASSPMLLTRETMRFFRLGAHSACIKMTRGMGTGTHGTTLGKGAAENAKAASVSGMATCGEVSRGVSSPRQ
jgi:hypothetical protein